MLVEQEGAWLLELVEQVRRTAREARGSGVVDSVDPLAGTDPRSQALVLRAFGLYFTFKARELEVLLRSISSDERAIRRVIRRFRRLARGSLHPANWLNGFPFLLRPSREKVEKPE